MPLRLSIIIPIYNVAPYVDRCLRSLENQDIPKEDYEIICINDGSPDNSREVVCSLQKEFENIILIDQENQGVSRARNHGIDKALGTFLLFIDPDDYIVANSLGHVLKTSIDQNAEISFLGYTFLNKDGRIHKVINNVYQGKVFQGIEAYFLSRGDGETDPDRMVAVLYKTDFLKRNNLRYLHDVPYLEDGEFITRILCLAKRCIFDGHSFYQRTTRLGSATNSNLFHSELATNGFLMAAKNLKRFQEVQNLNGSQREFLNQPICKFVILAVTSAWKPFSFKRIRDVREKLVELGLREIKLASVNKEYMILGHLYIRSVYLVVIYQFLMTRLRFLLSRIYRIMDRRKHSFSDLIEHQT